MNDKFSNPSRALHAALGVLLAFCFAFAAVPARGQATGEKPEFMAATQQWLDNAVASSHPAGAAALRMEVVVGELDSRLRLAPCARVEPYIPAGMRLWGKSRLGLRCLEGSAKWNVFLPVTIRALGTAWVIKGNVAAGATLSPDDAVAAEVDWAEEASPVVANASQWVGQVATRALATGQVLRQNVIKSAQVFQAGSQVRVVAQGAGFEITSDGQAVSAGVIGQPARVRMDNGRVMSGVVLDNRTVKIEI